MKKFLSLILCAAMLFSLAACTQEPAPTEDPSKGIYTQAADALNALSDVSSEVVITTLTTVDGDEFSEKSTQVLTYQAKGTADAIIVMDETVEFSVHSPSDEADDEEEDEPPTYKEIWYKDTVYAQLGEAERFSSALDAKAAAARYTPIVLLDASLYGSVTSEVQEKGTLITFAEPTAPEGWALPQDREFVTASGTALVNPEGKLAEMIYEITYTYGPAQVKVTVESRPLDAPETVEAPKDTEDYPVISSIDALRISMTATAKLVQMDTMAIVNNESVTSEAAGVVRNQTSQAYMHGRKKDTIAKFETSIYMMANRKSDEFKQEETYKGGKLTTVTNDGLPSTVAVDWEDIRAYMALLILSGSNPLVADYWNDVTISDLGSVYYLEFALNDNFGNTMQNSICQTLFQDPSLLINLATSYKNSDLSGYLSIDKYTGLPVAAGYTYKGIHTIEKKDYALSMQFDQSIEAPAKGAYKEITGDMPEEKEPENKATPLFYKVTGKDGQQMWLFGTIHVGDERTAYLPQEIRDAFEGSDALALECDTKKFDEQVEKDEKLAEKVSKLYFYTDGKEHIKKAMSEEDYALALKYLKAVGGNNSNMPYAKPYVWSNTIEQFYLRQGNQLHRDQGVEERLTAWAKELGKEIREIESSMEQIKMLTGFSQDLQLWMLEDILEMDGKEYWEDTAALYELWCVGNEEDLRKEIANEWGDMTEEEKAKYQPLMDEYYKHMSTDRNEGMLKTAIEYLESGDVVFYAVGLAHLLDSNNGLVDTLQQAGYTVELVQFAS